MLFFNPPDSVNFKSFLDSSVFEKNTDMENQLKFQYTVSTFPFFSNVLRFKAACSRSAQMAKRDGYFINRNKTKCIH